MTADAANHTPSPGSGLSSATRSTALLPRWLPTRIRSKLIFLHTMFSLALTIVLLLALRNPVRQMMYESEAHEALLALRLYRADPSIATRLPETGLTLQTGSAERLGIPQRDALSARERRDPIISTSPGSGWLMAIAWNPQTEQFETASVRIAEARLAANRLYLLLILSLLAIYGVIAAVMEVFVLPKQVYGPIRTILAADDAVRAGDRDRELVPPHQIPADELGQIMRSRNQSIGKLREQEEQLADALRALEEIASELKRKNHLLETARRNLADQDRLASLGMMSAGIAHELNTPLAVLKGTVEDVVRTGAERIAPEKAALMLRVLGRLERLSESLLDFARARPPKNETVDIHEIVTESWTLVSLDRDAANIQLENRVHAGMSVTGDGDRLMQVLVNLIRNAVDALDGSGSIAVDAEEAFRDGSAWTSITVSDDGPGIDPSILPRLFEPFASTRLDSHGTGLGLAVAEGIVREHGGVLLARNAAPPRTGAIFELMLPRSAGSAVSDRADSVQSSAPVRDLAATSPRA